MTGPHAILTGEGSRRIDRGKMLKPAQGRIEEDVEHIGRLNLTCSFQKSMSKTSTPQNRSGGIRKSDSLKLKILSVYKRK